MQDVLKKNADEWSYVLICQGQFSLQHALTKDFQISSCTLCYYFWLFLVHRKCCWRNDISENGTDGQNGPVNSVSVRITSLIYCCNESSNNRLSASMCSHVICECENVCGSQLYKNKYNLFNFFGSKFD